MQLANTTKMYGWVSIVMHWLMALLLFGMFGLGIYMVELTYVDVWYKAAPELHKSIGMLLLLMLVARLGWRLYNPLPVIFGVNFERVIALLVHRLHYVFMFAIMVTGYLMITADGRGVMVFTWFEVPAFFPAEKGREEVTGFIHMILAWAYMGFVGLHAAAALKHHVVDQDRTLLRMLGIKEKKEEKK